MGTENLIEINLNFWDKQHIFHKHVLNSIDPSSTIQLIKDAAGQKLEKNKEDLLLTYGGLVLENNQCVSSYGLTNGSTIHVMEKSLDSIHKPLKAKCPTKAEVQQFHVAFRAFNRSSGHRAALQRLSRPEILENIIKATQGLSEDSVAIAFIQYPELLIHLADCDCVKKIAEQHPALIEAAHHIMTQLQQNSSSSTSSEPSTSSGYSYTLDALSEDEGNDNDEDLDADDDRNAAPLTRNASYNAITSAQLAAAIASATNTAFNMSGAGTATRSPQQTSLITSQMFSNAMQQAFQSAGPTSITNPADIVSATESNTLRQQVQQMREMGLTNDVINVRALNATSGDVQAAVELVFSGVFNDTE